MGRARVGFALGIVLVIGLSAAPALATDFYVDPVHGSMSGDGSKAKPWKTLEAVVAANLIESQKWKTLPYAAGDTLVAKNAGAPVKAGDTVYLMSGYHGAVTLQGYYNTSPITIAAAPGQKPELSRVLIQAGKNWKVSGLYVSPGYAPTYNRQTMFTIESHNYQGPVSDVVVEGCTLQSKADVSAWTASDWDQLSANGFSVGGSHITIRGNHLKNVNFGISVGASDSLIEHNVVDSFAGDGMRGLGDNTVFQYNLVKNCYDVNANHDDGFQSWSVGANGVGTGQVTGIVLRGNTIINYEDPKQPFRGTLQGIGCFDGTYVDWVVENNVIITDHWHGITFLGAKNVHVINNTVIDPNTTKPGPPWIDIGNHKDGTPPVGCIVRNNLVTDLNLASSGVTEDHNIIVKDYSLFFVDAAGYDLHLVPTASAIDQGSPDLAPPIDEEGIPRPEGAGFDVGAYEWHDPSVTPPDGGPGSGGSVGTGGSGGAGAGAGGAAPDGGSSGGSPGNGGGAAGASSSGATSGDTGGCGCRTAPCQSPAPEWFALLFAAGLATRRTRSRQT